MNDNDQRPLSELPPETDTPSRPEEKAPGTGGCPYPYGQPGPAVPPPGDRWYPPEGYPYRAPAPVYAPAGDPLYENKRAARREIFSLGLVLGAAFLLHLLFSRIYAFSIRGSETFLSLYRNDLHVQYLMDTLYSLLAVGLPFLIIYLFLRRTRAGKNVEIPLGPTYPDSRMGLLVFAGLGFCMIGSLVTNYFAVFADSIGLGFTSFYEALEGYDTPEDAVGFVLMLLRTALVPAVVEELCFRGVILQSLRKYGDWFAIGITAFLFGLMHANMTQMPFAIIAGFAMGYAAVVTGSLRTSILIHFLNNFISCVAQIALAYLPEGAGRAADAVLIYVPILIGVICFAVYVMRRRNCMRLYGWEDKGKLTKKARFFLLAPTMLIAIVILSFNTICDIKVVGDALLGGWM